MSFGRVPGNMAWGQVCAGKETRWENFISSRQRRAVNAGLQCLLHQAVGTIEIYEQGGSSLQL